MNNLDPICVPYSIPNDPIKSPYLDPKEIIREARKAEITDVVLDFAQSLEVESEEYFDITSEELALAINQLNIQTSLSKRQLNQIQTSGYINAKVL